MDLNICHIVSTAELISCIWLSVMIAKANLHTCMFHWLLNMRKRSSVLHMSGETLGLRLRIESSFSRWCLTVRTCSVLTGRRSWAAGTVFFSPCTPEGHGAAAPLIWMFNYDNSSAASSIGLWGNVTQTPGCYKSSRCAALCLNLHIIHFTSTVSRIRIISSFHRADVKTNSPHHLTLIGM